MDKLIALALVVVTTGFFLALAAGCLAPLFNSLFGML